MLTCRKKKSNLKGLDIDLGLVLLLDNLGYLIDQLLGDVISMPTTLQETRYGN